MLHYVVSALLLAPLLAPFAGAGAAGAALATLGRRRSLLDRIAVALLVLYAVVMLRVLLVPDGGALLHGRPFGQCDFAHWLPLMPDAWGAPSPAALLLWLMAPLGLLAMLADQARRALTLAVAIAIPAGVELVQALVPSLGKDCSSVDLVTAVTGVMLGILAGIVLAIVLSPLRGKSGRRERSHDGDAFDSFFDER